VGRRPGGSGRAAVGAGRQRRRRRARTAEERQDQRRRQPGDRDPERFSHGEWSTSPLKWDAGILTHLPWSKNRRLGQCGQLGPCEYSRRANHRNSRIVSPASVIGRATSSYPPVAPGSPRRPAAGAEAPRDLPGVRPPGREKARPISGRAFGRYPAGPSDALSGTRNAFPAFVLLAVLLAALARDGGRARGGGLRDQVLARAHRAQVLVQP